MHSWCGRLEAKDLLGDDWVQRQRRIVQQHANAYQRPAWAKVTSFWQFYSFSLHHMMNMYTHCKSLCTISDSLAFKHFFVSVRNSQDWPSLWAPICNLVLHALSYLSLVFYKFLVYRGFHFIVIYAHHLDFKKKFPRWSSSLHVN